MVSSVTANTVAMCIKHASYRVAWKCVFVPWLQASTASIQILHNSKALRLQYDLLQSLTDRLASRLGKEQDYCSQTLREGTFAGLSCAVSQCCLQLPCMPPPTRA